VNNSFCVLVLLASRYHFEARGRHYDKDQRTAAAESWYKPAAVCCFSFSGSDYMSILYFKSITHRKLVAFISVKQANNQIMIILSLRFVNDIATLTAADNVNYIEKNCIQSIQCCINRC